MDLRRVPAAVKAAAVVVVLLLGAAIGVLLQSSVSAPDAVAEPGGIEVGFAQDMTVHHRQAVTMGSWARDRTTDGAVRQLAFDVERGQTEQIGRMQGWLAAWDRPSQPAGRYMTWMPDDGHNHGGAAGFDGVATMPGMATEQELARLRSLSGREMDVYFLQLMRRHHQGGLPMAQYAFDRTGVPAVRALARSIVASQTDEVGVIEHMLFLRGAKAW
ncbi:DUF305 domain-containing protein [Amycolatopsis plumensis]|uniref:DUF305 domain-containing protein n=1 Tax=Amycolatopsis plumensis TaxID=236508 RepID=UPI00360BC644